MRLHFIVAEIYGALAEWEELQRSLKPQSGASTPLRPFESDTRRLSGASISFKRTTVSIGCNKNKFISFDNA